MKGIGRMDAEEPLQKSWVRVNEKWCVEVLAGETAVWSLISA